MKLNELNLGKTSKKINSKMNDIVQKGGGVRKNQINFLAHPLAL